MFSTRHFTLFVLLPLLLVLISNPWSSYNAHVIGAVAKRIDEDGQRRILLLTAHPDDECMFFAPTILQLVASSSDVHSLCLSTGDSEGLGEIREKELAGSLDVLGVPPNNRRVLSEPFKDNISIFWDTQLIAENVKAYVREKNIDTILTFDNKGISSHPNHISLMFGALALLSEEENRTSTLLSQQSPRSTNLRVFTLETVSLLPKYSGIFDIAVQRSKNAICALFGQFPTLDCESPVVVSSLKGYTTALRAMLRHKSQLVWFRWLYVSFSRYMWVNKWVELSGSAK